jgi:hypothetical protein
MAGDADEGAVVKKAAVKTFSCPSCGAPVSVKALGQTVAVGCQSCGALIDVTDDNYRIISEAQGKMLFFPAIPLGRRGTLHGEKWEVIGFMVRTDGSGVYSWREYLLFNPYKGFRWLTEYNGHWNYVITTRKNPSGQGNSASYLGKTYKLYNRGEAKVVFVIGEFYWRVKVGETVKVEDYINPPEMLSAEVSAEEEIWSIGEYIEADTIYAAFKPDAPLPTKIGVAPNQPNRAAPASATAWKYAVMFIGILFVIQIATLILSKNELVYHNGFMLMNDKAADKFVTPSFVVGGGASNLEFTMESPVDNSWIDLDIDLVNDITGEVREFTHGVEFYHGRDSDGAWSEGGQKKSELLSSAPDGTYHMDLDSTVAVPSAQKPGAPPQPRVRYFELTVRRGVATWSAFVLSILAVLAYPLTVWARGQSFEVKRWEESDFSPYQSND